MSIVPELLLNNNSTILTNGIWYTHPDLIKYSVQLSLMSFMWGMLCGVLIIVGYQLYLERRN